MLQSFDLHEPTKLFTGKIAPIALTQSPKRSDRDEPPAKISKLAVVADSDEDRYDVVTKVMCYGCGYEQIHHDSESLKSLVDSVMKASTFSRREEVKAWEQEYTPCEHTLCLQQVGPTKNTAGHPVAVKLGSITPEGNADVYCYHCNEERIDTELSTHLAHWGINISEREKTEKSLVELQIEQNLKWDFTMAIDGQEAEPMFGPGFTGLKNLGNSCYLASTLQCLFSIPAFQDRYFHPSAEPPFTQKPAEDLETQLRKIADGLLSGRYSRKPTMGNDGSSLSAEATSREQKGLSPAMFKHLVGRGHEEFSTMRQQDAFEFLQHLFKIINLSKHSDGLYDPTDSFRFAMEQKLQCLQCGKVKYKLDVQDNLSVSVPARLIAGSADSQPTYEHVSFRDCLDSYTGEEIVEMTCPSCGSNKGFTKRMLFKTLPDVLIVNARRFALVNWVPTKLDIPVDVDEETLDMSRYLSPGLQPHEEEIAEESIEDKADSCDPVALGQLLEMGFSEPKCRKALASTQGSDSEAAMEWLFAHMDDPDPEDFSAAHGPNDHDASQISQLCEMGINTSVAAKALGETNGDVMRAIDWVFTHPDDPGVSEEGEDHENISMAQKIPGSSDTPATFQLNSIICHKGTSVHAGHYVSFVKKEIPGTSKTFWTLYNDEKVVRAAHADEMKKYAYVYFFRRV
ncbi:hypothetical protein KEM56_006440 [Ascosphaera pollenicola]|nr:hypothetical protein KEM56_006440 [Ascosphaera pollenicola]